MNKYHDKSFTKIESSDCDYFLTFLEQDQVLCDREMLLQYGHDETEDLVFPPEIVLKPATTEQVSSIMEYCSRRRIPVTPIGAQTGLSGGALSVFGGVGLAMERMNRILEIDERNFQATVEPGVITQEFQESVAALGLYYAPDPASRGSCFIGGNVAENSGGPRALKYGVTKDWVLNLEVVLPDGQVIWTGANTLKNSTGYNLTQLMVGSEGTLGVITKMVFKLMPLPTRNILMLAPFKNLMAACNCVSKIFKSGVTPSALELMEKDAMLLSAKYANRLPFELRDNWEALLLIEVDGGEDDDLMLSGTRIMQVLEEGGSEEVLFAEDASQKEQLWMIRRQVGEAVKRESVYKEEDTVVPRAELGELLGYVKELGARYGFRSICYGHAGDGNLHINILKDSLSNTFWDEELPSVIRCIFEKTYKLGGTLSGEHGIGLVQKEYMDVVFSPVSLRLQLGVKALFDPQGILNPGKVLNRGSSNN